MRLVLASTSPRRAELLTAAGFTFEVVPVDVDERVWPGEVPEQYVRRLAIEKSEAALEQLRAGDQGPVVVGADTAVTIDDEILGKPRDDREAAAMLRRLAARRHVVMTGVSVRAGDQEVGRVVRTAVWFAPLTDEEIAWLVGSGEGTDKAGGYAIQGLASRFVTEIQGSYSNVVGLPMACVWNLLKAIGA
jgi:septum formation protein